MQHEQWSDQNGVQRTLVLVAVFGLPFTLALTLDLAFPLKLYEVALLGAAWICFTQFRVPSVGDAWSAARPLLVLLGFALFVLLLHTWLPPEGLSTSGFTSRFGPFGDGIAKLCYLALAILGFLLIAHRTRLEERFVLRVWLGGAIAAALYAWYLFGSSLAGVEPMLLPGIDSPQRFSYEGRSVIRSGTFEEGNFLGLYLLTSVAIALYTGRRMLAIALSTTVFITFSTVNVIGLVFLWSMVLWLHSRKRPLVQRLVYAAAMFVLVLVAAAVVTRSPYWQNVVVQKLAGADPVSRLERLGQAVAGLRMFSEHPVTGVGISQYGYYYHEYEYLNLGVLSDYVDQKRIPNNIYVELLSELGAVGFLLFIAFLIAVFRRTTGPERLPLRLGFLAVLIVWNAFPTYSMMFLWAFFGVIVGGWRATGYNDGETLSLRPS